MKCDSVHLFPIDPTGKSYLPVYCKGTHPEDANEHYGKVELTGEVIKWKRKRSWTS